MSKLVGLPGFFFFGWGEQEVHYMNVAAALNVVTLITNWHTMGTQG